jgi:hypothetical protein
MRSALTVVQRAAQVCALLLLVRGHAAAEDRAASPQPTTRVMSFFTEVGPGAPYGWLALGADFRPVAWWSLELGGGLNFGSLRAGHGQMGLGTGFHLALSNGDALGLLIAASWDQYAQHNTLLSSKVFAKTWNSAWGYLGAQGRKHLTGILFMRGAIGVTVPFASWSSSCDVSNNAQRAANLSACASAPFSGTTSVFGAIGLEVEAF